MREPENKTRSITADFLKGMMILCVMYGHSISMINSLRGVTWQNSSVNVFLTSFEMPLFIMISGYFLWFSLRKKTHFKVLCQRIISIALPLLVWEAVPVIYHLIIEAVNGEFLLSNVKTLCFRLLYPALWFLGCYLMCTIFVILTEWLLSKIHNKKARITFKMGVEADTDVIIMTCIDGKWEAIESVVNNGDGTVTGIFEDICPVAFVVQNDAPVEEDTEQIIWPWFAAGAALLAIIIAIVLFIIKRAKAK